MRATFGGHAKRLAAILGREDLVPLTKEIVADKFEDIDLVVNQ